MKAAIFTQYGLPEVLKIGEVPRPIPKKNEILVKIMAATVNSSDMHVRGMGAKGFKGLMLQLMIGITGPRKPILGSVFSGIVVETGQSVSQFKVGDSVYGLTGLKFGTHAEYIAIPEKIAVTAMPSNASFEEAAAILFGGQTARYFLQKAEISAKKNQKILIYGATGAVGTAALQIANYYGANITAVCSKVGRNLVQKLGAEHVLFYEDVDFWESLESYDIIFDAVGKTSKKQFKSALKKGGRYFTVNGHDFAWERKEQLIFLKELFEQGNYNAAIDKIYTLDQIVEAHQYVDTGRKKGNVVLSIGLEKE